MEQPGRPMITVKEAAERTGISRMTLYRWAHAGRIRGYQLGPRILRLDEEDIEQLARPLAASHGA